MSYRLRVRTLSLFLMLPLLPLAVACASGNQSGAVSPITHPPAELKGAPRLAFDSVQLADGTPVWAGETEDTPHLAELKDGAWTVIDVPAKLRPYPAYYSEVAADAEGNLYVGFNQKGEHSRAGLLARIGGTWSKLGEWESIGAISVISSQDLYVKADGGVRHWDGKAFTVIPLPAGEKSVVDLALDHGTLVAQMDESDHAYRLVNGAWAKMGAPAERTVNLLVSARDGSIWRLGRKAEHWTGTAWEQPFRVPEDFMITDAFPGPKDELYLVLQEQDKYKDHLAAFNGSELSWLYGAAWKAKSEYMLNGLVCDATGLVHLDSSGKDVSYTPDDLDYLEDGYPRHDAKATEVFKLVAADEEIRQLLIRFGELHRRYLGTQSEDDYKALNELWEKGVTGRRVTAVFGETLEALKALNVEPERNRLYDAYFAFIETQSTIFDLSMQMARQMHDNGGRVGNLDELTAANDKATAAARALENAKAGYTTRNAIAE